MNQFSSLCFGLVAGLSMMVFSFQPVSAQQDDCDGMRYRYLNAFENFSVTYDVEYGNSINATGLNQSLVVDIYEPEGDTNESRPLIVMAHGGFFIGGENDAPDVLALSQDLTR